jgi:archaeal flagellin FlaB
MFRSQLHKNESGQTALETAIILIAFVVVASVFAFTILSAGSASTQRGEEAIYAGLEGVQASLQMRGAVIAESTGGAVTTVIFTVTPVNGGEPVNIDDIIVEYRSETFRDNNIVIAEEWISHNDGAAADDLLEEGEVVEFTATIPAGAALAENTEFTLEVKPPTGGVLLINRTTPAGLSAFMELR